MRSLGPERVLAALAPRGLLERGWLVLVGGFSAGQIYGRATEGENAVDEPTRWQEVSAVVAVLRALEQAGRVRRQPARLKVDLRGKGTRNVIVDVYRLTGN